MSKTAPFAVGTLVATTLEAFLATAALHLGETLENGRQVDLPEPDEAWLALYAAAALLDQCEPTMAEALHTEYQQRLDRLLATFERRHPGPHAKQPPPLEDLADVAARAWAAVEGPSAAAP